MSELHILQVQTIRIFPSQEEGGRVPFVDLFFRTHRPPQTPPVQILLRFHMLCRATPYALKERMRR